MNSKTSMGTSVSMQHPMRRTTLSCRICDWTMISFTDAFWPSVPSPLELMDFLKAISFTNSYLPLPYRPHRRCPSRSWFSSCLLSCQAAPA
ncbi:Os11g0691050 [Oryza sativa Japonica Group]|uniref:Os11g0691050 protein n=1 Tax=Oryza sativa subsp. japonica TaxID=39947 RepID=A0A0N7KTD5_ORYSJ|nr:Os11g0691050 [Oryza sativa Japonica Group]